MFNVLRVSLFRVAFVCVALLRSLVLMRFARVSFALLFLFWRCYCVRDFRSLVFVVDAFRRARLLRRCFRYVIRLFM